MHWIMLDFLKEKIKRKWRQLPVIKCCFFMSKQMLNKTQRFCQVYISICYQLIISIADVFEKKKNMIGKRREIIQYRSFYFMLRKAKQKANSNSVCFNIILREKDLI